MRRNLYNILTFFSLALLITLSACEDDDKGPQDPIITVGGGFEDIDGFNVGDEITIPVSVKSPLGIKRLAYYFITATDNGTESGTPVFIDMEDLPQEVNKDIVFTVAPGLVEIVIITFDSQNNNSEIHITPKNIRSIPAIAFKDDIKSRESVFEGKTLQVEGTITSEYALTAVTYQTVIDGVASEENAITITDENNMPFLAEVVVRKKLSGIIIKAVNIYEGTAIDTFKIGSVVDDDVNITLEGGNTTIPIAYAGVTNTLNGNVFSGTGMVTLTYAVKSNDTYGAEVPVTIGTPSDEFPFTVEFVADKAIQAVRFTGTNAGGITRATEFAVDKVYTKLVHFSDITLTSKVGAGLNNWFSAYQAPHVFDVPNAANNQLMVDFALVNYNGSGFRIMPAAVFAAGDSYRTAMAPYMQGFTKAPYTLVTANRNAITQEAFDALEWDGEMMEFLDAKVRAPKDQGGENYNFYGTNRRTNSDLQIGKGFIIGWGQLEPTNNQGFGLVMVKDFAIVDGEATVTLEIKVPAEDQRTKYNPVSVLDYP